MRNIKQLWPLLLLPVIVFVLVLFPMWRQAVDRSQDARADPHHIAGNLYFVGSPDVAAFLIIGPEGDALIGSSHRGQSRKIIDNIEQLGFDIRDVKMLLATDPHNDEAGGLFELQRATGAELWASDANAEVIARGGKDDPSVIYMPYRFMSRLGIADFDYSAPRVHHPVNDGETVRLGSLAFTANITPGHSPGCTTWTFTVRDRDRDLRVVYRCGLEVPYGASLVEPRHISGIRADFERTFRTLRSLPVDIWLTSRGVDMADAEQAISARGSSRTLHRSRGLSQVDRRRRGEVPEATR